MNLRCIKHSSYNVDDLKRGEMQCPGCIAEAFQETPYILTSEDVYGVWMDYAIGIDAAKRRHKEMESKYGNCTIKERFPKLAHLWEGAVKCPQSA